MTANFIKRLLLGTDLSSEYPAVALQSLEGAVRVMAGGKKTTQYTDVTTSHLFLGYSPLIVGLTFQVGQEIGWMEQEERVCLTFSVDEGLADDMWNRFATTRKAIARLIVLRKRELILDGTRIVVFEGQLAHHSLLSPIHRITNSIHLKLKKKISGNVEVPGNRYEQVRAMYTVPRAISIVSLMLKDRVNLFPTDLHARIGNLYVDSLRKAGKASQQVDASSYIALSSVSISAHRQAHEMGKNHMKDPQAENNFSIDPRKSEKFNLPLPTSVLSYFELEKADHLDIGIHRIYFFRIVNSKILEEGPQLACVHKYYLQWRLNHGLDTQFIT